MAYVNNSVDLKNTESYLKFVFNWIDDNSNSLISEPSEDNLFLQELINIEDNLESIHDKSDNMIKEKYFKGHIFSANT